MSTLLENVRSFFRSWAFHYRNRAVCYKSYCKGEFFVYNNKKRGKEMLRLENVSKSYGKKQVLQDVSYSFEKGKIVSVLSPNGTGKTTLLGIVGGFILPDCGKVIGDDKGVNVVLAGEKNLYPKNTVIENIMFFSALRGGQKEEIKKRLEDYQKYLLEFSAWRNCPVEELSYGQKKIVSILSAMVTNASFILLDEAAEGLDLNYIQILKKILMQGKKEKGFLIVSQDCDFLTEISDEIIFLNQGKLEVIAEKNSSAQLKKWYRKQCEGREK